MSAAATAAGYLYASGRLRGKNKESDEQDKPQVKRKPIRVAALPEREYVPEQQPAPRAPKIVRVEYRTRRWRPDGG
jgi:hypothetical protein